jgi:hypothetical protein
MNEPVSRVFCIRRNEEMAENPIEWTGTIVPRYFFGGNIIIED